MYPYLFIYSLSSLFSFLTNSRSARRLLAFGFALVLVLFVGTRFEVGCDYTGYANRFERMVEYDSWGEIFTRGETGFYLLSVGVLEAGWSFSALLFISGLIYVLCLWRFSQLSERPLGFLALCFPILVVQLGMSGIRQALALGFLLLAFKAFTNKQRLAMAALVLIASQFHTSAIVFLPLVFSIGRQFSIWRIVAALVVLGPVVGWLIGERMDVYADRYVNQVYGESAAGGAWIRYALVLVPFIFFEWKRALIELAYPKVYPLLRLASLITFSMVLIGAISSVALHRMTFYVMPLSILAMFCIAEVMFRKHKSHFIMSIPYLVYGIYFAGWILQSRHASLCYIPYQSWLF